MSETVHPLMQRRISAVERQRAFAIDHDLRAAIDELERQAKRVDAAIGAALSGPLVETCARFRATLDHGRSDPTGGRTIHHIVADRRRARPEDAASAERTVEPA